MLAWDSWSEGRSGCWQAYVAEALVARAATNARALAKCMVSVEGEGRSGVGEDVDVEMIRRLGEWRKM